MFYLTNIIILEPSQLVKQSKSSYFKQKFKMMNELPEEVIEDPNEQSYSEFPTKRTNKGRSPINKQTLISANDSKERLAQIAKKPAANQLNELNDDLKDVTKQNKILIKIDNSSKYGNTKVPDISTLEKPYFPDSKSVSLSMSSKFPNDDDETRHLPKI